MISTEAFLLKAKDLNDSENTDNTNLVVGIEAVLLENGLGTRINDFRNSRYYKSAEGKIFEVQRMYMNEYFFLQLSSVDADTIDARRCLVENGTYADWINLFNRIVVKRLAELGLPSDIV